MVRPEPAAGLVLVLALHGAALYGLWSYRLIPMQDEVATLLVNIIEPERPPKPPEPPKPLPPEKPRPVEPPRQLVAQAPVISPAEPVAPPPPPAPPAPVVTAPPAPPKPAGPITLGGELSVACPERPPPRYPSISRRLSEEGTVVLRVELDEQGQVARAAVATGSGFPRLDEAAQAAVKGWRCTPARRDGQLVRAVALQPFKFVLE